MDLKKIDQIALRKKTLPIYRIAILGASSVGKTQIINSFVNNCFDPIYEETDSDIRKYRKIFDINRNEKDPQFIIFQIEDIFPINHKDLENGSDFAKNQIYYSMLENKQIKGQSKGNQNILQIDKQIYGYIFVFDVNDPKSFNAITDVIKYIWDYCETKIQFSGFISKKIIVGNKTDLLDFEKIAKIYEIDERQKFFHKYAMQKYTVSAKTSQNISMIFEELGKQIITDTKIEMIERSWFSERAVDLNSIEEQQLKKAQDKKNKLEENSGKTDNGGCVGRRGKDDVDSDEEVMGFDEEDDEFEDFPLYDQNMDDQNDGCYIF